MGAVGGVTSPSPPTAAAPGPPPRSISARESVIAGCLAVVMLISCSSGTRGLGKGACPYVRPRLIRVDTDRAKLPAGLADLASVAQDFADYVRTNLPAGGRAHSDQVLVRFSAALSAYARTGASSPQTFDTAEAALAHECAVHGY